jgi:DNA (cytosine-5)-methyltransferase 1
MESITQLSWTEGSILEKKATSYFDRLLHLLNVADNIPAWPDAFGAALHAWIHTTLRTPIRTLSLFSGGGGLDIAFHDTGFSLTHMIEIDSRYVETLTLNSQTGRRLEGAEPLCIDIKDFVPPDDMNIDFVIGGPPCQTFSAAGRRAAGVSGFDDPRGVLFQEYVRLLRKLQPRGFLFENVYGILGAQNGKPWKAIVKAFEQAGYKISYRILDAADYGVPQQRERLIIVGTRDGNFAFPRPTHGPDSLDQRLYYAAGLAVDEVEGAKPGPVNGRYGHLLRDIPPGLNYSFYTEKMGHPTPLFSWRSKFSDLLYKADPDMPVRTIKAQGGQYTGPFHWENRSFSIDELKRLQTFPDDYTLTGGRQVAIQQIGNSVPPQFGRILAISILNQLFGVAFPCGIDYLSSHDQLGFRSRKASFTAYYQRKAKEAIARQFPSGERAPIGGREKPVDDSTISQPVVAYLGADFTWAIKNDRTDDYPWNVEYSITQQEQLIELYVRTPGEQSIYPAIVVEIYPTESWIIPAKRVHLLMQSPSPHLFTAAWKAFEHYLAKQGIKADLVQLNGYYHYKPAIFMKLAKLDGASLEANSFHEWKAIRNVLEAIGVRRIISLEHLANLWELPLDRTIGALLKLRTLGYEVRSSNTNNQIPSEHVLIPYAFPTLNPQSVQLRKTLFPDIELQKISGRENANERTTQNA